MNIEPQYRLVDGARLRTPLSAQVVGEELERIRERDGGLTPRAVVEESRPTSAPLHSQFTWDVQQAAEEHWINQARQVIRSITIVPSPSLGAAVPTQIRAFVSVGQRPNQVYTSVYAAMSDATLREQVLQRALRELRQWRERYRHLDELAQIFAAMDNQQEAA